MKYGFRWYWALALVLVALALGGPPGRVLAQNANDTAVVYSQEELDQLLAPVALYPDALLAQLLSAATYPLEVVQAARFVQQNPGLKGCWPPVPLILSYPLWCARPFRRPTHRCTLACRWG